LNAEHRPEEGGSRAWLWLLLGCGGAVVLLVILVAAALMFFGWKMSAASVPAPMVRRSVSPESNAAGALRAYCSAQAMFHRNDWDADGKLEYATPYTLLDTQPDGNGQPIRLIDAGMTAASGTAGSPRNGYLYRDMKTIAGAPIDWVTEYAFCAIPAQYGRTGRRTFIVTTNGTVYGKDLGSKTAFVDDYPADPQGSGWTLAE